jgi:hypothetical protein
MGPRHTPKGTRVDDDAARDAADDAAVMDGGGGNGAVEAAAAKRPPLPPSQQQEPKPKPKPQSLPDRLDSIHRGLIVALQQPQHDQQHQQNLQGFGVTLTQNLLVITLPRIRVSVAPIISRVRGHSGCLSTQTTAQLRRKTLCPLRNIRSCVFVLS